MATERTQRTVHEVTKGSNLDLLIRGFHGIGNRLVDALGSGLQAIALALSTPNDNSAAVQDLIEKIRAVRKSLQTATDNQTKGEK